MLLHSILYKVTYWQLHWVLLPLTAQKEGKTGGKDSFSLSLYVYRAGDCNPSSLWSSVGFLPDERNWRAQGLILPFLKGTERTNCIPVAPVSLYCLYGDQIRQRHPHMLSGYQLLIPQNPQMYGLSGPNTTLSPVCSWEYPHTAGGQWATGEPIASLLRD